MWSPYGLRSLSSKDSYYKLGDYYWTGPIWLNINYLITQAFHEFKDSLEIPELKEDFASAYNDLR